MFKIQDDHKVYRMVKQPAAVFDKKTHILLKIGEYQDMLEYYSNTQDTYRNSGLHDMASDIVFMELPKDQDEIDKVFQITNYIGTLYNHTNI